MEVSQYFEDYEIGQTRLTTGRTITETNIVFHSGHSGDFFPHHVDAEWCKTQPFGQRIAHGTLTFAVGVGLTAGEINPRAFTYGYDRLRFPRPVHIGDTLRTRVTVSAKTRNTKRPGLGRVTEAKEVLNQRDETVLCCEHILMVECRDAQADNEGN